MRAFIRREPNAWQNRHFPVVICGAGPIGLALAVDLAQRGIQTLLVDKKTAVGKGSRAVTFARRSLEIFDKLGIGHQVVEHGIQWSKNRTWFGDEQVDIRQLQPEDGINRPAYVNIQQYHVEDYLLSRANEFDNLTQRWGTRYLHHEQQGTQTTITFDDEDGEFQVHCDYLVAADGVHSPIRRGMNLSYDGRQFNDRFLIADVEMQADRPPERCFWFSPEFHEGYSVLLHQQPDNIWRIDFQLGWDSDPDEEVKPENITPRLKNMLGDTPFSLKWASVYTFECRQMTKFVHDNVIFVGDAAHRVSPFGARGANSGFQDVENLAWKLEKIIKGRASDNLLQTYSTERVEAARQNLERSSRSTDFITPKSNQSLMFRDAVLTLAKRHQFARLLINSGRLYTPDTQPAVDTDVAAEPITTFNQVRPGEVCIDAPILHHDKPNWLLNILGNQTTLMTALPVIDTHQTLQDTLSGLKHLISRFHLIKEIDPDAQLVLIGENYQTAMNKLSTEEQADVHLITDNLNYIADRYVTTPGATWLIRPDNYVISAWQHWHTQHIKRTLEEHILCRTV